MSESITRYEINLDNNDVAIVMGVNPEDVTRILRDGRGASPWVKTWVDHIGRLKGEPWSSSTGKVSGAGVSVVVRTLTPSGVKFVESKNLGSGRTNDPAALNAALEKTELFIVGDITRSPKFVITPIHSKFLRQEARARRLTHSGWDSAEFERFVRRYYTVTVESLSGDFVNR